VTTPPVALTLTLTLAGARSGADAGARAGIHDEPATLAAHGARALTAETACTTPRGCMADRRCRPSWYRRKPWLPPTTCLARPSRPGMLAAGDIVQPMATLLLPAGCPPGRRPRPGRDLLETN